MLFLESKFKINSNMVRLRVQFTGEISDAESRFNSNMVRLRVVKLQIVFN